jgi:hypothetical protein
MSIQNEPLDQPNYNNPQNNDDDELHVGLKILAVCIPLAGAIMYFTTNAEQYPNKRKQACNFALIGMALGFVLRLLSTVAAG